MLFRSTTAVVNIYAVSSTDAKAVLKAVPYDYKPVSCLVPLEYVLTQLLANTVLNPVISVWVEHQQVLILATKGKEIISRGTYLHTGDEADFVEWLISNKYIQNVFDLVKRQEVDQEVSLLVWGESYRHIQRSIEQIGRAHV